MHFWENSLASKTIKSVPVQCEQDVIMSSLFSKMLCCLQFGVVLRRRHCVLICNRMSHFSGDVVEEWFRQACEVTRALLYVY